MKSVYKYIVASVAVLLSAHLSAQEVVTDQLIYDRVKGYMAADYEAAELREKEILKVDDIRWKHDVALWIGAPGLISEALLDNLFNDAYGDDYYEPNISESINELRTVWGPRYKLPTLGVSYSQQLRPWFSLGVKASVAGIWQYGCDVYTGERLYNDHIFNVTAMLDARFSWLHRKNIEMYSSVALGLCAHIERLYGGLWPMADVALIGMKIGGSFYGFWEIGVGVGGSARAGLGVRFNSKK